MGVPLAYAIYHTHVHTHAHTHTHTYTHMPTQAIEIAVRSHAMQRFAVWFGGSLMACDPAFGSVCHTREQYQEYGPRWGRGWKRRVEREGGRTRV